jgi:DNA processing protein
MDFNMAILRLVLAPGLGSKTLRRLLRRLESEGISPDDFVRFSGSDLAGDYGLAGLTTASIEKNQGEAQLVAEELERHEVQMVVRGFSDYPERLEITLGEASPPVLFVRGDLSILDRKGVAFCGSRRASSETCRLIQNCAAELADNGFNVIAGYSAGVDLSAHYAAVSRGGVTTCVLPTGILHFRLRSDLAESLEYGNHLIISQFPPAVGWHVYNAMQRNYTVCGLADVVIVAEPGSSGGTFEAAMAAVKLSRPVFLADQSTHPEVSAAKGLLAGQGAKRLQRRTETDVDLMEVYSVLGGPEHTVR